MVFKRRDPRTPFRILRELVLPRGGWARAFRYMKYRLARLPDTPERIARGVWAGVFAAFTPFYGLHFFVAALVAWIMRGSVFAALMATFFGNPLTYLPIIASAMLTGYWLLGLDPSRLRFQADPDHPGPTVGQQFADAARALWHNFKAMFTSDTAHWAELSLFYQDVFLPFLVGGLIPGAISATVCYVLSVPLIRAFQNSRRRKIQAKFEAIKKLAAEEMQKEAEDDHSPPASSGR